MIGGRICCLAGPSPAPDWPWSGAYRGTVESVVRFVRGAHWWQHRVNLNKAEVWTIEGCSILPEVGCLLAPIILLAYATGWLSDHIRVRFRK